MFPAPLVRRLTRIGTAAAVGVTLVATPVTPALAGVDSGGVGASTVISNTFASNEVNYWTDVVLEAYRRKGGGPGPLGRIGAIVEAAMFDAANGVVISKTGSTQYDSYLIRVRTAKSVEGDLAIGVTARDLLTWLVPGEQAYFNQAFSNRYGTRNDGPANRLARRIVNEYQNVRGNDGSGDTTAYTFDTGLGAFQSPQGNCSAIDPNWGGVTPFAMSSATQFRTPLPYGSYAELMGSDTYRTQLAEVRSLGRANSTTRTQNQTDIGYFWANDLDGTYKPPGQYLDIVRDVALAKNTDGLLVARTIALGSLAMADAGIAAWDMKYRTHIDLWRPVTAIKNDPVNPDPTWQELSADYQGNHFSPCFPAYVSGHATFGGAFAGVLRNLFGDATNTVVTTEDPNYTGAVSRTYTSFTAMATENARSRVYLGVHYQWDADYGQSAGIGIANLVAPPSGGGGGGGGAIPNEPHDDKDTVAV
jgi:hypothetical protein